MTLTTFIYIDPGSGSYLVQVLIAAVLGIVFFFKNIGRFFRNAWWYIKSFFIRTPKDPTRPDHPKLDESMGQAGGQKDN